MSLTPSASEDLARCICQLPCLRKVELDYIILTDDFYAVLKSNASSVKVKFWDLRVIGA